ncbi:MAG TPA: HAMP domain-containing sensor histidine kinase [Xanthobacteraceae bacterium]|nr:HAMP domain-containing sensor histidine kinase [Xanthobacteraceae bacterium]
MTDHSPPKEHVDLNLLSNFLHQVINPLNGVCGTIDNILGNRIPPGSQEQRLRATRAQLEHCITLVRNLAFFSQFSIKPEKFKETARNKTTVIPQAIIEAMMFFQETARKKNMKVHLEDRETQYKISADPDLIRQVFMNIFDNGVKYGIEGSTLLVETRQQKSTGDLRIMVSGYSPPVPQNQRPQMFEMGFRGQNALDEVASGTGLGLYICRMIVQGVYGGQIRYSTEEHGQKSIFTINFGQVWI